MPCDQGFLFGVFHRKCLEMRKGSGVGQAKFDEMPEPVALRLVSHDGQVLVTHGRSLVYRFDAGDIGMRNLAIVALADAGRRVDEVAAVFGLTATYVSMLRGQARREGSAGLVRRRGRPPKLSARQVTRAREWASAGWTQQAIADRLGVAQSVISELLARLGPASVQQVLPTSTEQPVEPGAGDPRDAAVRGPVDEPAQETAPEGPTPQPEQAPATGEESAAGFTGSERIGLGSHRCRYAGAMLLY